MILFKVEIILGLKENNYFLLRLSFTRDRLALSVPYRICNPKVRSLYDHRHQIESHHCQLIFAIYQRQDATKTSSGRDMAIQVRHSPQINTNIYTYTQFCLYTLYHNITSFFNSLFSSSFNTNITLLYTACAVFALHTAFCSELHFLWRINNNNLKLYCPI